MFDVTTARQIDYTDAHGNDLQVTVFRDRTDESVGYLVPTPRLRINNGQPVFNLTKYTSNGNGIAGSCVFEVELFAPTEAKRAAEQQIPGIKSWGQFTWTSGTASFDYELPVDGQPVAQQIIVTPSLFGTNTARFQVELETEDAVNTFISAFSGEGGVSQFSVLYEMGVLTQLLGAEATISFRASVAIDYERTYKKKKDTWGKSHKVLVSVKQNLKSSGAGDVKVTKGAGGTAELVQLVRDWAWGRLEQQIADAIEIAQRRATGNEDPISVLSDLNATYKEDTIVEWATPVSRFLPRFDAQTWGKLYHEVDNRQLVVTFDLAGAPADSDRRPLFEDVEVTVKYPTRTTDNTFKLSLAEGGQGSCTYVAPGQGRFDPNYQYRYKVNFGGGAPSYTSDWIDSDTTRVSFRPNMFGIRNITFIGTGIPFEGDSKFKVSRVFIDFFEEPPAGQKAKLQTKEMTADGESIEFSSTYHVPVTNSYTYRLRYQLANGDVVTIQPGEAFGSENADQVFVLTPQEHLTSFDLRALTTKGGTGFLEISANAAYYDEQNSPGGTPPNHNWDGWIPDQDPGLSTSPTWTFKAQPDPQTDYFTLNGQVIYGDGDVFPMVDLVVPYNRRALVIKDTEQLYGVTVFDDQVDWEKVAQVTVNVYQLRDADGRLLTEPGGRLAPASLDDVRRAVENRSAGSGGVANFMSYSILPPAREAPVKSLPLRYTLNKPRTSPKILFYFNAEYVMSDGSVRSIAQTEVENKLQIHLPPEPTEERGMVHAYLVDVSGG